MLYGRLNHVVEEVGPCYMGGWTVLNERFVRVMLLFSLRHFCIFFLLMKNYINMVMQVLE